jgi:thioredoxin 1
MRLNPVLDELAKEQQGLLKIYKINVQSDNQLAAQFQVQGIPALFLFQNGVKISSKNGFLPKKQLLDWIMANIPLD